MLINRLFLCCGFFIIFQSNVFADPSPLEEGQNGSGIIWLNSGQLHSPICQRELSVTYSEGNAYCVGGAIVDPELITAFAKRLHAIEQKINVMIKEIYATEHQNIENIKMLLVNVKTLSDSNDALTKRLEDMEHPKIRN